ncbi:MAG: GreA/GreB family elongation factor [Acidobacteriota bacterium]
MSSTAKNPPVPADIDALITEGKLDAVEDAWMQRIDQKPESLDWFLATADAITTLDPEMAKILIQMLDDQLEDREAHSTRLALSKAWGQKIHKTSRLHEIILESLQALYGDRAHYDAMVDKVGLTKAVDDIPKTWQKAERFESLMGFDVGAIVRMKDKGAGRIEEVNMVLESFLVSLEGGLELRVGFGGAAKLLDTLEPDHILRRKLEEPEVLKQLRKDDPAELLRLVLDSEGRALTGAEIKQILQGVVTPQAWNRFWTAARKHPQVLQDPKNKRAYLWAESTEDAQDAVWEAFQKADPRQRIALLRRDGDRDEGLNKRMSVELWRSGEDCANAEPGLAVEVWLNLERSGMTPPSDAVWAPERLIGRHQDLTKLFAGVEDRPMRERAYELVRKNREDWLDVYSKAIWHETDARALDTLSNALFGIESERFEPFFDQLVSQPIKYPALFTWLVERAADKPQWMARNPLRLMKQLMFAMTHEAFAPFRAARLVPMVESGGTLPRLLNHLEADQAASALDAVKTSPGLEDYQREPMVNAIHLRFQALDQPKEAPLYATEASIRTKREELKHLAEVEIPENREAIETAREMGDLRENFEYHAARARHEYLSDRAGKLDADLRRVQPIRAAQVSSDEVVVGARVHFAGDAGERSYTILGPWESDPDNDVLSNESELAQKLLGLGVGDDATLPDGAYKITAIEPWE